MNLWERVLLWLVDTANDSPPLLAKKEFYAIKDRMLRRYGTQEGTDLQHVRRECWNCEGNGCERCFWTGTYEHSYVLLQRYRWGPHVFHRPISWRRSYLPLEDEPVAIRGHIKHKARGHLPAEAWYWLALIYDRAAFRRTFGYTRHYQIRTPMVALASWFFDLRFWWERVRGPRHEELPF